jgi:hypothetical protein
VAKYQVKGAEQFRDRSNLAPENREIQLEARYDVDLARKVTATMSLHHAMNRGNRGDEMESGVFFGMRSAF